MHASIWRFRGDPDELLDRYDAMVAEIPRENMRLHLCLRDEDGIVMVVWNVPHTSLVPSDAVACPFAMIFCALSLSRHTTFASKTRAAPESVSVAPTF